MNENTSRICPKHLFFHLFSLENPQLTPKNASFVKYPPLQLGTREYSTTRANVISWDSYNHISNLKFSRYNLQYFFSAVEISLNPNWGYLGNHIHEEVQPKKVRYGEILPSVKSMVYMSQLCNTIHLQSILWYLIVLCMKPVYSKCLK